MNFQHLYKSKTFRTALITILGVSIVLAIFETGVAVGHRKAAFSYRFGEGYYRVFSGAEGRDSRGMMGFFDEDLPGGHGATGKVIRILPSSFVVASPDNTERIITTNSDTIVRRFRDVASTSDIKIDDFVITLGSPDEMGKVNAKFIRIMPPPASTTRPVERMMYFR
jgi:hypothetical protein